MKALTYDRALRDGFVLHAMDEEVLRVGAGIAQVPLPEDFRGMLQQGGFLTPPALLEHADALNLHYRIMVAYIAERAEGDPALLPLVVDLRIEARYSWRMVAERVAAHLRGAVPWAPPWNQLAGMAACEVAADAAGADCREPPWN